jgi:PAS domain S-box-containing protein
MASYQVEQLCREIVFGTQDAVIFADREGIIQLWNPGATRIFGYGAQQACGKTLDLIIPEKLRDRHWEGYRQTMASGETRYGSSVLAVPALRKDGARISVEFTVTLIRGVDGELLGIAALMRDVTERWEQDKALRQRLKQLEGAAGKA